MEQTKQSQQLTPLSQYDLNGVLLKNDIIKIGEHANLLQLAGLSNQQITSENTLHVDLKSLLLSITDGTTTEELEIPIEEFTSKAGVLVGDLTPRDISATDRVTNLHSTLFITGDKQTISNGTSALVAKVTDAQIVKVYVEFMLEVNPQTSDTIGLNSVTFQAYNRKRHAVPTNLTMDITGFSVNANLTAAIKA